jgi:L-galactose dehydrogenase
MQYRVLGKTKLNVSVMGLGCGGISCLGKSQGKTTEESVKIVQEALNLGINLIDTSEFNQTETIIANAIQYFNRENIILSTKKTVSLQGNYTTKKELIESVNNSLKNLHSNYLDIFHFHSVTPEEYKYTVENLLSELLKLKASGKIRFIGITEAFVKDPSHKMLQKAIKDDYWDVIMVGFNFINQSARKTIFPEAINKNIGILGMFAVRNAFRNGEQFKTYLNILKQQNILDQNLDDNDLLNFILNDPHNQNNSLPDIAYRYCRDEMGINSVLVGTGNKQHLNMNFNSFLSPPLSQDKCDRLKEIFGHIDFFSGN